jgi:transcription elongation factor SPT5
MATSALNNVQFDDSEDDDDNFNPVPADMSDDENAGGDNELEAQIRGESARKHNAYNDEKEIPRKTNGKSKISDEARDIEDDEDIEDEEGKGEDVGGAGLDDEDEDDEEDEDEEEVTVCTF